MNSPLPKPTAPILPQQPPQPGGNPPQKMVIPAPQPISPPQQPTPSIVPTQVVPSPSPAPAAPPAAPVPPAPSRMQAPALTPAPKQGIPQPGGIAQSPNAVNSPMPPRALSALSSMTSSTIPQNTVKGLTQDPLAVTSQPPLPLQSGSIPAPVGLAGAPTAKNGGSKPKFATAERPYMKFVVMGVVGLLVVGIIGLVLSRVFGGDGGGNSVTVDKPSDGTGGSTGRQTVPSQQTTVEYWGLWEPNEVMAEVIAEFESENPTVKVVYSKQSHLNYRERLQTAIASGNGPDVFRFHASWVPMLAAELKPIPASIMTAAEYKSTYYPVATSQLQVNGQYVGVPMMYDGLALLYNKEMFKTAGVEVPTDWGGIKEVATKLVVKGSDGKVSRGGIAMGNATNVDHFADILGLLMLQNGADLTKPSSQEVADALTFFTSFQTDDGVWSSELPNSTVAFARGEVAMILAPSWRIHEILAANPDLDFGVSTVPMVDERLAWATYWAEGINAKSKNQEPAAAFLKYLTKKETLQKFYTASSKVRAFGELYPRVDMAEGLAENEYVAPYLADAPYAKSWYLSSNTFDNGINDQLIKYYQDAVTSMVVEGKKATNALETVNQGTTQVLRQYGVSGALSR